MKKLSSSLENFVTVRNALEKYGPNVIRIFYLGTEYSSEQTFSEAAIAEAEERWDRLKRAYETAIDAADSTAAYAKVEDPDPRAAVDNTRENFQDAMNDDFNVREAMAALLELTGAVHRHVDNREEYDYHGLRRALNTFDELGRGIFGLQFDDRTLGEAHLVDDLVELVLDIREDERNLGNYERADELRNALADLSVAVEDSSEGSSYRFE